MKYSIFNEDKSLIICEKNSTDNLQNYPDVFVAPFPEKVKMIYNYLQHLEPKSKYNRIILTTDDVKGSWIKFKGIFRLIKAGGGLVFDENKNFLAIYRKKKWDLPKGKMDKKETFKETALREVAEETGIKNLKIEQKLGNTYHIYKLNKRRILKVTRWYLMSAPNQKLIPQLEEDIEKAEWIPYDQFKEILNKSYPNIKYMLSDKEKLIFDAELK